VPRVLVPDNGLEFATTALSRACATLGITLAPTDGYAPYQKGKVERANLTGDPDLICVGCARIVKMSGTRRCGR
jgi:transposase InsO family protein